MAPTKGTKRAAQPSKSAPASKVPKKCPLLAAVEETIEQADLSESCRMMLLNMTRNSLAVAVDKRHAVQTLAVEMVSKVFDDTRAGLQQQIDAEGAAAADAQAAKDALSAKVADAEARLAAEAEVVSGRRAALAEASKRVSEKSGVVSEVTTAQCNGDAALDLVKTEKEAYEVAFETAFKAVRDTELETSQMKAHYDLLQPLLAKLSLDDSLVTTLPKTLMTTPSARGAFDEMVMKELEACITKHISSLVEALEAGQPAVAERSSRVVAAQQELDVATKVQETAASELSGAEGSEKEASEALQAAKHDQEQHMPEYQRATCVRDEKIEDLRHFESHNVESFKSLKDRASETTQPEAEALIKEMPQCAVEPVRVEFAGA